MSQPINTARGPHHHRQQKYGPHNYSKGYVMDTSEVLNRAADLIEERGWSAGTGWNGDASTLCVEGGIAAAMGVRGGPGYRCPAYSAVCSYLQRPAAGLWMWNDTLPYSMPSWEAADFDAAKVEAQQHVVGVLRACAVIEAARGAQDAAWETYAELVAS